MTVRVLASVLLVLGLVGSCSIPLGSRSAATVAFSLSSVAPGGTAERSARLIAAETASVKVTVETKGAPDEVSLFTPTIDTSGVPTTLVIVKATVGLHTILVQSLDADNEVLSEATKVVTLIDGKNTISLTLLPPLAPIAGSTESLKAGRIQYYWFPATLGGKLQVNGTDSTFWVCPAAGTFSGSGTAGSATIDLTLGDDVVLRVKQGAAGTFSVDALPSADVTISFAVPDEPNVIGAVKTTLNASLNETLTVTLGADAFDSYTWFVDGHTPTYSNGQPFAMVGKAFKVESQYLANGTHEISVIVSNAANPAIYFSAKFHLEVIR